MNDRFLVVKYIKEFIYSIDEMIINFPRKDFVIKDRIINDSLNILEMVYIANVNNISINKELKTRILSKLSTLDFYLERSYKNKIISEKVCKKYCAKVNNISKLVYGWIRNVGITIQGATTLFLTNMKRIIKLNEEKNKNIV